MRSKERPNSEMFFFLVVEKQNYRPKEILVRASEGETLAISAKLDPMTQEEMENANKLAKKRTTRKNPNNHRRIQRKRKTRILKS